MDQGGVQHLAVQAGLQGFPLCAGGDRGHGETRRVEPESGGADRWLPLPGSSCRFGLADAAEGDEHGVVVEAVFAAQRAQRAVAQLVHGRVAFALDRVRQPMETVVE